MDAKMFESSLRRNAGKTVRVAFRDEEDPWSDFTGSRIGVLRGRGKEDRAWITTDGLEWFPRVCDIINITNMEVPA